MECPEFELLLNQRLDERSDPRCADLQAHAAGCPACQLQLEDAGLVLRGVAAWRAGSLVATTDLAGRIFEHARRELVSSGPLNTHVNQSSVHQSAVNQSAVNQSAVNQSAVNQSATHSEVRPNRLSNRGETRHSWHSWAVLAGTVAAVWFVLAGSLLETPKRSQSDSTAIATITPQPVTNPKVDLGTVLITAEGAYSQVANDSFNAAQDFALLWPTTSSNADAASPGTTTSGSEWNPGWTRELTPLGNSVEDAWEFLRSTVPHVEKSAS